MPTRVPACRSMRSSTSSARTLSHYRLEAPGRYTSAIARSAIGEAEVARVDCLPTISVPVGALFAGAPDTTL
jgi:hypothetical protein